MKKLFILVFVLFSYNRLHGQTLAFNDLMHLYKYKGIDSTFLTAKCFKLTRENKGLLFYSINSQTDKEEVVWLNRHRTGVMYHTYNIPFIENQVKLIAKKYKLILKDETARGPYYRFGDLNINIQADIAKDHTQVSDISIDSLKPSKR